MAFEGLSEKLSATFKKLKNRGKLGEADVKEAMREVRLALLEADVNYKVAKDFVKTVTEKAVGEQVLQSLTPAQQVIKIVNDEMTALMGSTHTRINLSSKIPTIILMCGLQGSGKTTHSAKLAYLFKQQGKMGQADPLVICKKALNHAKDYGNDIVIIDTAGRLHIDEALMEELRGIRDLVHPNETLLVIDSMTGQDAVNVAQSFDSGLGVDGVILTKLDGDTRGGAALSVKAATGKPIKFAGVGEKIGDLEPFYPDRMASRILGFGDVMTLIEKASTQMDQETAATTAKKLKEGQLDFNDLLEQMGQMKKMGSLSSILDMIPGMGGRVTEEEAQEGEKQMRRTEAIILSMTPAERAKPSLINPSRKRRIAAGSGTRVEDVNRLIKQLADTQKLMKQFAPGKGKKRRRLPFGGGMPGGMPGMPM